VTEAIKLHGRTWPHGAHNPKTPFTRYNQLSIRLSNRFDNRLYRVNGVSESRNEYAPCTDNNILQFPNFTVYVVVILPQPQCTLIPR